MKTKVILAAVVAAMVCTGCTTYTYTSRTVEIGGSNISASDLVVDIRPDFTRRVTGESGRHKLQSVAMEEAKYRALVDNKVDVLVDPIYRVEQHGHKFQASVVAFAGFYTNARTPMDDIKALEHVSKETIEKKLMLDGNVIVLEGLYDHTVKSENNSPITIFHNSKPCKKGGCDKEACCDKSEHPAKPAAPKVNAPVAKEKEPVVKENTSDKSASKSSSSKNTISWSKKK